MEKKWKKRYSFRLKQEDESLYELLENLPESKRSEIIRTLLLFAFHTVSEKKQQNEEMIHIKEEIQKMKELQIQQHKELLKQMSSCQSKPEASEEMDASRKIQNEAAAKAMQDSAAAMMAAFGLPP